MWSRALRQDPRAPLLRPNVGTPGPASPSAERGLAVPAVPPRWHTPNPDQETSQPSQTILEPPESASQPTGGSDVEDGRYGALMDDEDVRRLKAFLREFVAQSLVPHMEKCVQAWNEQVAASRRGITGKLFGAGRRMFGAARVSATDPPGFDAHRQIYPAGAIEALTRRLADFAFVTRDLKLAASLYEMVRKDFVNDKAWKYAAGASEMLGLCQLLQAATSASASSAEAEALLGQACHEFSLGNHTQLSAIRASLLFYEAQRYIRDWRNVEPVLIRAAGFAEEISSAIFLEQAALANLRQSRPALRKFAVRLVMAGHRYQACGQKHLSLRCFAQAACFYRVKDWNLISNHIEHELGRQAYMEGNADQAVSHLLRIIRPVEGSAVSADTYLGELLSAYKYTDADKEAGKSAAFPFELFRTKDCAFEADALQSDLQRDPVWDSMEERFLRTGFVGNVTGPGGRARWRPMQLRSSVPDVIVGLKETLTLKLTIVNPLGATLELSDIKPQISEEEGEENATGLSCDSVDSLRIEAHQTCVLRVRVTAAKIGQYRVRGVHFTIGGTVPFFQSLQKHGARLYATKEQKTQRSYAADRTLAARVRESRPKLKVELQQAPVSLYHGQDAKFVARLTNVGHDDVYDMRLLTGDGSCFDIEGNAEVDISGQASDLKIADTLREDGPGDIQLPSGRLQKDDYVDVPLHVRAAAPGALVLRGLIVYQNEGGELFTVKLLHVVRVMPSIVVAANSALLNEDQPGVLLNLNIANVSDVLDKVRVRAVLALSTDHTVSFPPTSSTTSASLEHDIQRATSVQAQLALNAESQKQEDNPLLIQHLRSLLGPKRDEKAPPLPEYSPRAVYVKQTRFGNAAEIQEIPFLAASRRAWRLQGLAAEFPAISELDQRRVFPLFDINELDLVVAWESDDGQHGYLPLFGIKLGPLRSRLESLIEGGRTIRNLYAETAQEQAALLSNILGSSLGRTENPVVISLVADRVTEHDFESGAARIPIQFKLCNYSDRQKTNISFRLLQSAEDVDAVVPTAPWVGRSSFCAELEPGAATVITAHVWVQHPAVMSTGLWVGDVQVGSSAAAAGGLSAVSAFALTGADRVLIDVRQTRA